MTRHFAALFVIILIMKSRINVNREKLIHCHLPKVPKKILSTARKQMRSLKFS